jgi:hypothetical protein
MIMAKKTIAERRKQVRLAIDPVEAFIEVELDSEATVNDLEPKTDVYDVFDGWCEKKKVPKMSEESFGDAMKKKGYMDTRQRVAGKRRYYWVGVKLLNRPRMTKY